MANIKDLKARIKAVKNVQQITKAMKMVAAAKIKKAESKAKAAKPYTEKMGKIVEELVSFTEEPHQLYVARETKNIGCWVITADKGLCGSYNHNILRLANQTVNELKKHGELSVMVTGQKARQFYSRRDYNILHDFPVSPYPEYSEAEQVAVALIRAFLEGEMDEIWCVYTKFISAMLQSPAKVRVLPLSLPSASTVRGDMLFEPNSYDVLDSLLPQYITVLVYTILLESRASELGARLVAMGNATDNAQKLIEEITLKFYRARQETITKEIIEVASGAEALKGG